MRILLTNDDGIDSEGIRSLAYALKNAGNEVFVVAPSENNSAVSHKINMRAPVKLVRADFGGVAAWSAGGTPADCVLIAVHHLKLRPDLLISGINTGLNLGTDTWYSGTVAGALEGAFCGIPSLALSQKLHGDREEIAEIFQNACKLALENLAQWYAYAQEAGAVNINFPDGAPKGTVFCRVTRSKYRTQYEDGEDGLHLLPTSADFEKGGDIDHLTKGYITVSPLTCDLTNERLLNKWRKNRA